LPLDDGLVTEARVEDLARNADARDVRLEAVENVNRAWIENEN
jgi:hypothetical protein